MTKVFIAGSIKIKNLAPSFVDRITNVINQDYSVLVGDANGADTSIQNELKENLASSVTVYCSGEEPRNNLGNWEVKRIKSSKNIGTREFFTEKDKQMALDADFGLMIWDAASTGTLNNVFELISMEKYCVVFVNKHKTFINIKSANDINELVSHMSVKARTKAETKIGLTRKIFKLQNSQLSMAV